MGNRNPIPIKVFTERQITLGTFFGGPLASGILISKNYKALGDAGSAKKAVYLGILGTIILLLFFYFSPHSLMDKIPNQLIPFVNIFIVYLIVRFLQKEKLNKFLNEGGVKESYWKTIGIGVICFIVIFFFSIIVLANKAPYDGLVKSFGKINNAIYYDSSISGSDIDVIGNILTEVEFFNNEFQQEIQIRKEENNIYHMFITADKEFWNDEEIITELKQLATIVQNNLSNKNVYISFYYDGLSKTETKRLN